jgi:hypothetical protein
MKPINEMSLTELSKRMRDNASLMTLIDPSLRVDWLYETADRIDEILNGGKVYSIEMHKDAPSHIRMKIKNGDVFRDLVLKFVKTLPDEAIMKLFNCKVINPFDGKTPTVDTNNERYQYLLERYLIEYSVEVRL